MKEKDAPISLAVYDRRWAQLFSEEKELLAPTLLPWLAGPIEHIGSTAVSGLQAKPVIDIMAAVKTLEESQDAISAIRSLGYHYAPYKSDIMHWFCKPRPSFRTHHLHLVPFESQLWLAQIKFRNRLREDRDLAAEYTELKKKLVASFPEDRDAYTDGKSEFVARVIEEV